MTICTYQMTSSSMSYLRILNKLIKKRILNKHNHYACQIKIDHIKELQTKENIIYLLFIKTGSGATGRPGSIIKVRPQSICCTRIKNKSTYFSQFLQEIHAHKLDIQVQINLKGLKHGILPKEKYWCDAS